jgi:hypothetical protein
MKRYFIIIFLATTAILSSSCRDKKTETKVIKEVKVEKETPKKNEGILERAGKEVDKEVNEEIDKKIDDIGND